MIVHSVNREHFAKAAACPTATRLNHRDKRFRNWGITSGEQLWGLAIPDAIAIGVLDAKIVQAHVHKIISMLRKEYDRLDKLVVSYNKRKKTLLI